MDSDQRRPTELSSHRQRFSNTGRRGAQDRYEDYFCPPACQYGRDWTIVTTFPRSVLDLDGDRFGLKVLPVDIPNANWPVKIATLRNRSMSAVVKRFIACASKIAQSDSDRKRVNRSK